MNVKNCLKKDNLMPIIVLAVICLIVAGLLGAVNMITKDRIASEEAKKITDSLYLVLPNASFADTPDKAPEGGYPETVTAVYTDKNGGGYAVTLKTTKGFTGGALSLTVGISTEGKIIGAVMTGYEDSLGKRDMEKSVVNLIGSEEGSVSSVELVTGATYSSNAVIGAVEDALAALGFASDEGYTAEEILTMAGELIGSTELTKENLVDAPSSVTELYKDASGKGYVARAVAASQYGIRVDGLVAIDNDGKIIGVKILKWAHGEGVGYTETYEESFIGKTIDTLSETELIAGATGSHEDFKAAIVDAISVVSDSSKIPVYTVVVSSVVGFFALLGIGFIVYSNVKRRKNG